MDNNQTPPPYIPQNRKAKSVTGLKIIYLMLICVVLMIGLLMVWLMSDTREMTSRKVSDEIASQWGNGVVVDGPVAIDSIGNDRFVRPSVFDCDVHVDGISMHKGIYDAEVYAANVKISGIFSREAISERADTVYLRLNVPAIKNIDRLQPLKFGENSIQWTAGHSCLLARVSLDDMPDSIPYSTEFYIRGSGSIEVNAIGDRSDITIGGESANPSFHGNRLPDERYVTDSDFRARWQTELHSYDDVDETDRVSVDFLVGVDRYQKVNRSMKYGFIIILLTFVSVMFVEIMMRYPIPVFNYLLIGVALILFYSLLLAFAEHMSFGPAYAVASVMTVGLITGYMWLMLHSRKVGLGILAILTLIYGACYVMLCLSTYSLLVGSLILFVALAAIMYSSLRLRY
ncbi:MAG: inner membrane CreD family protein [Bacteroidales bacterium]|nr:inner membrane CreD family protein [Bacteroidales bacterium]